MGQFETDIVLEKPNEVQDRSAVLYLQIHSVEEAKDFFGPITSAERKWRSEKYFDTLMGSPRSRLGLGEHDRVEAYVFGNGAYPVQDEDAHKRHFPIHVRVMNIDELTVASGEVLDLSARADEFPWDTRGKEIYLDVTIRKLTLSGDSRLVVQGNVFVFKCLEVHGCNLNGRQAIIELTGSEKEQYRVASYGPEVQSNPAEHGLDGFDGAPLTRESTPLGQRLMTPAAINNGMPGGAGSRGRDGGVGANGAMLFLSDLRFGQITGFDNGSIQLKVGASSGFQGSDGGIGGAGGHGGNGAAGALTAFGMVEGCPGGKGGDGGDGGNGGIGGNGGLACDVFVSVPESHVDIFKIEATPSPGGNGGAGGEGGAGGTGGENGSFYQNKHAPGRALDGANGRTGKAGRKGKTRPAPNVHIYERPTIK